MSGLTSYIYKKDFSTFCGSDARGVPNCQLPGFDNPEHPLASPLQSMLESFLSSKKKLPDMSEEELKERGMNRSMTHVDFMVGSEDLEITGIMHDGREIPVFRNGNFAF